MHAQETRMVSLSFSIQLCCKIVFVVYNVIVLMFKYLNPLSMIKYDCIYVCFSGIIPQFLMPVVADKSSYFPP